MIKEINGLKIEIDDIKHGKKCNIVSFEESLFNEGQFNALSKQYDKLGFLKCSFKYKNDRVFIYYDTTGLISINEYFARNYLIKETEFVDILKAICQSMKSSSNYIYFSDKNFVLDGDLIYINTDDKSIHIMYIPVKVDVNNDPMIDFKDLVREWIYNKIKVGETNFKQVIQEELRKVNLDLDEFIKFLNYRYKEDVVSNTPSESKVNPINEVKQIHKEIKPINVHIDDEVKPIKPVYYDINKTEIKQNIKPKKGGLFSFLFGRKNNQDKNTPIYNDYDGDYDTEILGFNEALVSGFLTGNDIQGNKEEVQINKDEFVIGRMKDSVDYYIPNKAVGKIHAKFIIKDGSFYLIDLESKNGTYINNTKLNPNVMYEVKDGFKITFANSSYMFGLSE